MKLLVTVMIAAAAFAVTAEARQGRWHNPGDTRMNEAPKVKIGWINIGNEGRGFQAQVIDVANNPHVECNLSHVRLNTTNDSVMITKVMVEYRRPDRNGSYTDTIDLSDDDDFNRAWGRSGRNRYRGGIYLGMNDSSPWLDLDDVQDGHAGGRCVNKIWIYGVDTPDMGGGRRRRWNRDPRWDRPAAVEVEGLLLNGHRPGDNGHDGGNGNGNHGGGRQPHHPPVTPPPPVVPGPPRPPRF